MNILFVELVPVLLFVLASAAIVAVGFYWGSYAARITKAFKSPSWKAYFISAMPAVGCFAGGIMAHYTDLLMTMFWILACACIITTFVKYYNLLSSRT